MIFKYCSWPSDKEDSKIITNENKNRINDSGGKFTESILRCCPCIFRCRRAIGIGNDNAQKISTELSNQLETVTPIIALGLNRNSETMYVLQLLFLFFIFHMLLNFFTISKKKKKKLHFFRIFCLLQKFFINKRLKS